MHLQPPPSAVLISTVLFHFLASAMNLDCERIVTDGVQWNLSKLGGPKSTSHFVNENASWRNTTYAIIDLCRPLKRVDKVDKTYQCPSGTRVCLIERVISKDEGTDTFVHATAIAGELKDHGGDYINAQWQRLGPHTDSGKEGLLLTINGGFYNNSDTGKKRPQKAVVEFICDKTRKGDENPWDPEDNYDDQFKRAEVDNSSLTVKLYDKTGDDVDVLYLDWRTKYACEDSKREQDAEKGEHWGFFTWFILIAFLSTATYLIFGSWLNYNRYGARGWDLLPHGDTIRDAPYLFKDFFRRILNTLQGGGSRGGYAAV